MPRAAARSVVALSLLVVAAACGVEGRWTTGEQLASCRGGDVPFEASVLTSPPLEDGDHPALPQIKNELQARGRLRVQQQIDGTPEIRLLSEDDGHAVFAIGDTTDSSKDFPYARFERQGDRWRLVGSGSNCYVLGWARGRKGNPWTLRRPAEPEVVRLSVFVHEFNCTGGRTAEGRIDEPTVGWTDDSAVVTITIEPPEGNQTCPGNPPTPFEFELPGPLGSRQLLDGSFVPPAPPGTPRDPT
jgi:hypothetical protein